MSAELMKISHQNLSVGRVAIFSEPHGRISFNVWLLVNLDHTPRLFFKVLKIKSYLNFFTIFPFSLTWDLMEAQLSNCYSSLKSLFNSFHNYPLWKRPLIISQFPWILSPKLLAKVLVGILKVLFFSIIHNFVRRFVGGRGVAGVKLW